MDPTGTNQLHDAFQKKCRPLRQRQNVSVAHYHGVYEYRSWNGFHLASSAGL